MAPPYRPLKLTDFGVTLSAFAQSAPPRLQLIGKALCVTIAYHL
jgi:hypothetical protein